VAEHVSRNFTKLTGFSGSFRMPLEAFGELVAADRDEDDALPNVLLGNGFSVARWPNIFSYSALYDRARAEMSVGMRRLFDGVGTRDFERVLGYLNRAAEVREYYDGNPGAAQELFEEAEWLKTAIVDAIADGHPADAYALTDENYEACSTFLANFDHLFTTNYDLLLYWALMRMYSDRVVEQRRINDGFFRDTAPGGGRSRLYFADSNYRRVHYLHGAIHVVRHGTRHRKLDFFQREDGRRVPIMTSLRAMIDQGNYPLFVCEDTPGRKLEQIRDDAFLSAAYGRLSALTGTLYIHGSALHPVDQHLWDAIGRSSIEKLRVSIHGDETEPAAERTMAAAHAIGGLLRARNGVDVDVTFYAAVSANIWG
jgi:hypothetical protein